jgi:5-methyltetrahydropteroyltriglutamate--homocysteine methyltransferase
MAIAHNLGFPRIGHKRELKKALEGYWSGQSDETALLETAWLVRKRDWELQQKAGLDLIPTGDFSLYDHMLDTTVMLGAVPERYGWRGGNVDLKTYFAMARGDDTRPAMEMTKWFDTNYHYIVPEFTPQTRFALSSTKLIDETKEALGLGIPAKPAIVGPYTFWRLGKWRAENGQINSTATEAAHLAPLDLIERMIPVYAELLARLKRLGIQWVQIDEPALVLDHKPEWITALEHAYATLVAEGAPNIMLTTYFGGVHDIASQLKELPVAGLHLDLVRAPEQLDAFTHAYPKDKALSLGVIDGRNVWRADLDAALKLIDPFKPMGDRLWIAPSCSLLHSPIDLEQETKLDSELRSWMSFAVQKLDEVVALNKALGPQAASVQPLIVQARAAQLSRQTSARIHDPAVERREAALQDSDARRAAPFNERRGQQRARLGLPPFPTTTIGSFPQTSSIRDARAKFKKGDIDAAEYERRIKMEIEHAVREQEKIGLDVLVHGEAERNDMVEYFGEQLRGFAFTQNGWVQSYGSRCVKPPIIFGDVSRPTPMTVEWIEYAQSLTTKPMKGMLTGPVTILQWSFVRDDQPRSDTALQIALAIRDEVVDLERAGVKIIQIDEPAIREGLPLKRAQWGDYLTWAVKAFRVASSGVRSETQIHTHMCYSEFNDIIESIAAMDADVITIESSRSDMEILEAFAGFKYPNEIGPGVYDIHSPRVPSEDEMTALLEKAATVVPPDQLWVNPDCGLKTRRWEEVVPALTHMVEAAKRLRTKFAVKA